MTSARYPLQAALELREHRRDNAQEALAKLLDAARDAQEALALAEQRWQESSVLIDQARAELYSSPASGQSLDVGEINRRRLGIDALQRLLQQREVEAANLRQTSRIADQAVCDGRLELTTAAQELTALEKHHDRWQREQEREVLRQEEKVRDEIVASAFARRVAHQDAGG